MGAYLVQARLKKNRKAEDKSISAFQQWKASVGKARDSAKRRSGSNDA